MKVLLISGVFPPVELPEANHAMHLATELARQGVEVHVLTTRGAVTKGFPFEVHAVMKGWTWSDLPRFAQFVRACAPDAVLMLYLAFLYDTHPMATFAPSVVRGVLPGVPFVTQFENVEGVPFYTGSILTRIGRRILKQLVGPATVGAQFGTLLRDSHRLIVLSGRIEHALAQEYPPVLEKSVLIPPPPLIPMAVEDPPTARAAGRAALGIAEDTFTVVFFGYLYKDKGVETLLEAIHRLEQRGRRVRLVIAGGICAHLYDERVLYVQGLHQLAESLGVEGGISWTGQLGWDTPDASRYLYAADACVLPFDFGVSMNNSTFAAAAAHGLPIVSTRSPIPEPQFLHGDNLLLCPPRDPDALAGAIESLMDRPELRARLRVGALAMAREWFSWDRAIARTVASFS